MLKTALSLVVAASCFLFSHSSTAGPLLSAEVTKIINRVSVIDPSKGGHPAAIREVIKDDLGLQTGARSRSELLFQDNTLTRIGAETFFSFKTGTRDLTLEKGSMLLQVPKGLGGAKIHTGAVTAAITGTTIMMEYAPRSYIKVLVLEGSLRLSRNGSFGDSVILRPGKMIIMRPDAKKIPDPIDVNLELIVKTSTLVNFPGNAPLPSMGLIQTAIDEQNKQLAKGHLAPTNLVMGHGTNVIFASNDQLARIRAISFSGSAVPNFRGIAGGGFPTGGSLPNTATSGTTTINNVLGSGGVVDQVASGGTTAINNLAGSGGVVGQTTNNLLGGTSSATAVSVSNSSQILGLLSNATSTSGGTIVVNPVAANIASNVQQNPAASNLNAASVLPASNGPPVTVSTPNGVLSTGGALPTIPATGVVPTQGAPSTQVPSLGVGH